MTKDPQGPITARVSTEKAARYIGQLAKHWAHKFEVVQTETTADIPLPFGPVRLVAEPDAILITLTPNPDADVARAKEVIENHLNRFAFREGELVYDWKG